jgi:hypothetical protein
MASSGFQQTNFLGRDCLEDGFRMMADCRGELYMDGLHGICFMEMKRIIGICVLLIVPSLAHSQAKQLVDLAVTCKESVGNSFVFQFKEAIRSSASYTLAAKDSAARPTLFVDIVCIDVSPDTSTPGTAVSAIAYTFRRNRNKGTDCSFLTNVLLYHGVRYMTNTFTKESAIGMLADIDAENSKQPYDDLLHQGLSRRYVGAH